MPRVFSTNPPVCEEHRSLPTLVWFLMVSVVLVNGIFVVLLATVYCFSGLFCLLVFGDLFFPFSCAQHVTAVNATWWKDKSSNAAIAKNIVFGGFSVQTARKV